MSEESHPRLHSKKSPTTRRDARRIAIAAAVVVAVVILLYVAKLAASVLLMAFAAALLATLLSSLALPIARFTGLGRKSSIIAVLFLLVIGGVGLGALVVPSFSREIDELAKTLPEQTKRIEGQILQYRWGRLLLDRTSGQEDEAKKQPVVADDHGEVVVATSHPTTQEGERLTKTVQAAAEPLMDGAGLFAAGAVNGVLGVVIVLAAGIYLALEPNLYRHGLLALFPRARRPVIDQTLGAIHYTLHWWLIGQAITMLVIGVLTGVGLWLIGVRLWLTFAILAGLFNFVPNFGPLVSFTPAILFSLADPDGGHKVIWITLLYIVAQTFEGYILTPMVQKKAVDTPPALLILFQVLAGLLLGGLGLMLAAPLLAAIVVAVKMLYVREVIGDEVEVEGASRQAAGADPSPAT